jgi:hypothetical protein
MCHPDQEYNMSMDPKRRTLDLMLPHCRWGFWRQDSALIIFIDTLQE